MVDLSLEIITKGMCYKRRKKVCLESLNKFFYAVVLVKRLWMLIEKLL